MAVFLSNKFGKRKIFSDLSASTVQTLVTQIFSLAIFFFTSRYLSKTDYGALNWSTATSATILAICTLGTDLIVVKRLASGKHPIHIGQIHLFHSLLIGFLTCSAFAVMHIIYPGHFEYNSIFVFVFLSSAISNVANSYKLILNGLEHYKRMAYIAFITNIFRFAGIVYLFLSDHFTLRYVVYSYILSACIEWICGQAFVNSAAKKMIAPKFIARDYLDLLKESLPQLAIVLFDSALARIDWILLGLVSTSVVTAEYSFTYKIFELSKLPLLIVAPVLLTRFSKLFHGGQVLSAYQHRELELFFKLELFIAMLIPIVMVCIWTPLIDYVSSNKYGAVNETVYLILAICVPAHYAINFLWTLAFTQGQLKALMYITISSSVINLFINILLIPSYGGLGSAIAFLISTAFQLIAYIVFVKRTLFNPNLFLFSLSLVNAVAAVVISKLIFSNPVIIAGIAVISYCILALLSGQLKLKDFKPIRDTP